MTVSFIGRSVLTVGVMTAFFLFFTLTLHAQGLPEDSSDIAATSYPIDLPTALRLAQAQNIDVQIARERIDEAKANHAGAIAQFLPWISVGAAFRRHEGITQAVDGTLLDVEKQSTNYGPTISAQVDFGEAIFATLSAKQLVSASSSALTAQQQDSTLIAASGYFDLLKAKVLVDVARDALRTSEEYQQQLHRAVAAGIVYKGDELRVQTQTERYRVNLLQSQQQQRVASARLAEILHLDPTIELFPQDSEMLPIALHQVDSQLNLLVQQAIASRAELKQSQALASAAREEKNKAVYGPWIPSLGAQAFVGEFGGGPGNATGNHGNSEDYYVGLSWRIGPGGLFDFTRINASEANLSIAEHNVQKVTDSVQRQVVESYSRLKSLSEQLQLSRDSLRAATETLRLARDRKQLGVGVVLEDIQAQQELVRARADYLSTITEFNKAQYEFSKALGMQIL